MSYLSLQVISTFTQAVFISNSNIARCFPPDHQHEAPKPPRQDEDQHKIATVQTRTYFMRSHPHSHFDFNKSDAHTGGCRSESNSISISEHYTSITSELGLRGCASACEGSAGVGQADEDTTHTRGLQWGNIPLHSSALLAFPSFTNWPVNVDGKGQSRLCRQVRASRAKPTWYYGLAAPGLIMHLRITTGLDRVYLQALIACVYFIVSFYRFVRRRKCGNCWQNSCTRCRRNAGDRCDP